MHMPRAACLLGDPFNFGLYKILLLLFKILTRGHFFCTDFREIGREGEKEGEKHLWERETSVDCLGLWDDAQPTEPYRPGLDFGRVVQ